jgi:hypothetical protein
MFMWSDFVTYLLAVTLTIFAIVVGCRFFHDYLLPETIMALGFLL